MLYSVYKTKASVQTVRKSGLTFKIIDIGPVVFEDRDRVESTMPGRIFFQKGNDTFAIPIYDVKFIPV